MRCRLPLWPRRGGFFVLPFLVQLVIAEPEQRIDRDHHKVDDIKVRKIAALP